ncbi:MAG: SDR family oxidoreductase [Chloroflexi bacterium]|nr:SDR family oxidoreductase [Chloroflexota bacterium]
MALPITLTQPGRRSLSLNLHTSLDTTQHEENRVLIILPGVLFIAADVDESKQELNNANRESLDFARGYPLYSEMVMALARFSVEGKVAIVTGASRGIGNALARGFAASGAVVVLAARSAADLQATVLEIQSRGGKALALPTDVTDGAQVSAMAHRTRDTLGRIDVLVNCAGGTGADRSIPLLEMDEEIWDRIVDLNLKSAYLCCRAVGRVMVEQRKGSIINFSSGAGVHPVHGMTHYGAAKAGINLFTKILSMELGQYNVRVNAISPGLIDTATERKWMPPELFERYAKAVPLGRVGQPDDILGLALFLASDASAYISGAIIPVGGGPQ